MGGSHVILLLAALVAVAHADVAAGLWEPCSGSSGQRWCNEAASTTLAARRLGPPLRHLLQQQEQQQQQQQQQQRQQLLPFPGPPVGATALEAGPQTGAESGPASQAYRLCSTPPEVLTGVSGRVTLSAAPGGTCSWLLSPSSPRPIDLSLDLSSLGPSDLVQLRLPHGLTVLLWPGAGASRGSGKTGGGAGADGIGVADWMRTVDSGDVLIELGHAAAQGPNGAATIKEGARSPVTAVGVSWWPARQEEASSSASMAALGATMASLMLLLVLGSFCGCLFRCTPPPTLVEVGGGAGAAAGPAAPHRVPTALRLQLKPTPYERLGAAGEFVKRALIAGARVATKGGIVPGQQQQGGDTCSGGTDACSSGAIELSIADGAAGVTRTGSGIGGGGDGPVPSPRRDQQRSRSAPGGAYTTGASGHGSSYAAPKTAVDRSVHSASSNESGTATPAAQGEGEDTGASAGADAASTPRVGCCAICLVDFEPGSMTLLLPCGHVFHHGCAVSWLVRSCLCPVCRADVIQGLTALAEEEQQAAEMTGAGAAATTDGTGSSAGTGQR